jgi:hypothetical protein
MVPEEVIDKTFEMMGIEKKKEHEEPKKRMLAGSNQEVNFFKDMNTILISIVLLILGFTCMCFLKFVLTKVKASGKLRARFAQFKVLVFNGLHETLNNTAIPM